MEGEVVHDSSDADGYFENLEDAHRVLNETDAWIVLATERTDDGTNMHGILGRKPGVDTGAFLIAALETLSRLVAQIQ